MKLNKLHYTVEDGIAVVQLDYPKNLNAIDEEMADELLYVVQAAEADESVKVVVFKGLLRAFSAGGDIGYFYPLIKASSIWAWSPIRAVPISWSNSWGRNGPWTSALPDAL